MWRTIMNTHRHTSASSRMGTCILTGAFLALCCASLAYAESSKSAVQMSPGSPRFQWKEPVEYYIHVGPFARHIANDELDIRTKYWQIKASGKEGIHHFEGTVKDVQKGKIRGIPGHPKERELKVKVKSSGKERSSLLLRRQGRNDPKRQILPYSVLVRAQE